MSKKKETPVLLLLLLCAAGLTAGGYWWANDFPGWDFIANSIGNIFNKNNEEEKEIESFKLVKDVPAGIFNYGGSTTWAPIRDLVDPAIQQAWPQFVLQYTNPVSGNPGSSTGIKMLLDGELAFSQSSRPLHEDEYKLARKLGFSLKAIPVGIDDIAIAVHHDLKVPGITVSQLKDIYTGKIVNWKQLGGPDIPLVPYSRHPGEGGTVEFFQENVLQGSKFGKNVVLIPDTTTGLRKVADNPGGLYYASAIQVVPQCTIRPLPIGRTANELITPYQEPYVEPSACPEQRNQLNRESFHNGEYPITRRLFVIVIQNGEKEERAGMAYARLLLTREGQKSIEDTGFISLHPIGK